MKRLSTLRPLFFPLSTLLCPATPKSGRRIPTPDESLRAVEGAIEASGRRAAVGQDGDTLPTGVDGGGGRDRTRSTLIDIDLPQVLALATANRQGSDRFVRAKVPHPRIVLFTD